MVQASNEAPPGRALGSRDPKVARLIASILGTPSALDAPRREAAARGDLEGPAGALARKVRDASHTNTQEDYNTLKAAGFTEEQLFELTVSAALGAARERLDSALAALQGRRSA